MSSPNPSALQQLQNLDRSSPNFHDQLSKVLSGEEYERSAPNLEGDNLMSLVDCLDKVRCCSALPYSLLKSMQALDVLDPTTPGFRRCLRELRKICGTRTILPASCTLSPSHLDINLHPVASGGPGDVYEGRLNGSKVCVKRVRVYSGDSPTKATKVHYPIPFRVCSC